MAGRKPSNRVRVMLRLKPADLVTVDEIAALSKRNRTAVVSELIDVAMPVVRDQLEAMKRVAESPERAAEVIANLAAQARGQIAQAEMEFKGSGSAAAARHSAPSATNRSHQLNRGAGGRARG